MMVVLMVCMTIFHKENLFEAVLLEEVGLSWAEKRPSCVRESVVRLPPSLSYDPEKELGAESSACVAISGLAFVGSDRSNVAKEEGVG